MVRLYADENFPLAIVELLRTFGHDVLTVQEAGNGGQGIPDAEDALYKKCTSQELLQNTGRLLLGN